MKNRIRNLLGLLLAFALGLTHVRKTVLSEDQESATSKTFIDVDIRDSEELDKGEGEIVVPTYMVYSREHLEELRKIFPQKRWNKDTTEAELAFNAGQQSVVDNIENRLSKEGRKAHVLN
jgi:hypothetical protein